MDVSKPDLLAFLSSSLLTVPPPPYQHSIRRCYPHHKTSDPCSDVHAHAHLVYGLRVQLWEFRGTSEVRGGDPKVPLPVVQVS